MRGLVGAAAGAALVLTAAAAAASTAVKVGGYRFPPYVSVSPKNDVGGLTPALLEALNAAQDRYSFQFVLTSPVWRYGDFRDGTIDAILFESPDWGWKKRDIAYEATGVFLRDREVYIAPADNRGDPFAQVGEARLVGVRGYHYGFAGLEADPAKLRQRYNITLVSKPATVIQLVARGRAEVGIVTESYLNRYLIPGGDLADRLQVSSEPDQVYRHRGLVRPDGPIGAAGLEALLDSLDKAGKLAPLWREYGIERPNGAE